MDKAIANTPAHRHESLGGGTDDKPVGLVYISVWHKGRNFTRKMKSMNGRDRVRMQAASTALDMIRRNIF